MNFDQEFAAAHLVRLWISLADLVYGTPAILVNYPHITSRSLKIFTRNLEFLTTFTVKMALF
ncbi:hypothetical protein CCP4SC76_2970001 [Gammaproteobacteria bacterium]